MKKITYLFVTVLLIVSTQVFCKEKSKPTEVSSNTANTEITGKVIDIHNGETLVGVLVKLEGTSYSAYTDFEGNFSFSNLQAGEYTILSKCISYKTCKARLNTSMINEQLVLRLESL